MLVFSAGTCVESACQPDQTCVPLQRCSVKCQLIEHLSAAAPLCEAEADTRCVLVFVSECLALGWRVLATPTRHLAGFCLCKGAAVNLRLIVHLRPTAPRCMKVEVFRTKYVLVFALGWRLLATPTRHLQVGTFAPEPP